MTRTSARRKPAAAKSDSLLTTAARRLGTAIGAAAQTVEELTDKAKGVGEKLRLKARKPTTPTTRKAKEKPRTKTRAKRRGRAGSAKRIQARSRLKTR
jgi:hypothetical protein